MRIRDRRQRKGKVLARCNVTRKVSFKSEGAAKWRIKEIIQEGTTRNYTPENWRSYQCEFCGQYHITGKPLWNKS